MTRKIVCGVGGLLLTGTVVAVAFCFLSKNSLIRELLPGQEAQTTVVLVPKQQLPQWTPIKNPETMLEARVVSVSAAPKDAVTSLADLKDRVLLKTLPEGEPVVFANLQARDKNMLEHGPGPPIRSIALHVQIDDTTDPLLRDGSHVDVVHMEQGVGKEALSKVIIENALVRAVDRTPMHPGDLQASHQGLHPVLLSLRVTGEQGLTLTKWKETGYYVVQLRPPS